MSAQSMGEFILKRIEQLGFKSQRQFALQKEVDAAYLGRLIKGEQSGSQQQWVLVSQGLKCRPGLLMDLFADKLSVEQALRIAEFEDREGFIDPLIRPNALILPGVLKPQDIAYLEEVARTIEYVRNMEHNANIDVLIDEQMRLEADLADKRDEIERLKVERDRLINERKAG